MDAIDLRTLNLTEAEPVPGVDADAWFMALDERTVKVGDDTCVARVLGIHGNGAALWIQVSFDDDAEAGYVLQVDATHSVADVLATLETCPPSGRRLEIVRVGQGC